MVDNNLIELVRNFTGLSQVNTLEVEIPQALFYYAEGLQNGYEEKLEDKIVIIKCTGLDDRDTFILKINIKEEIDTSKKVLSTHKQFISGVITFETSYQKARKLILDLMSYGMPSSINLITK